MDSDVILLAKNVDGVYNKDPKKYDDAVKYDEVSYMQSINEKLRSYGYYCNNSMYGK